MTSPPGQRGRRQNAVRVDAAEFGVHVRQCGWRLGLLVARCVDPLAHGGDRRSSSSQNLNEKVNATESSQSTSLWLCRPHTKAQGNSPLPEVVVI